MNYKTDWSHPSKALILLIVASGLLCLLSLYDDWLTLRFATKWVPAAVLALWVWQTGEGKVRVAAALGLFLSAIGDVTLEGTYAAPDSGIPWFAVGLGFFLLAHLCYVAAFMLLSNTTRWLRLLPMLAFSVIFFAILAPHLGDLFLPVLVYVTVITIMVWRSWCVHYPANVPWLLAYSAAWGATIFAVSDSMIAVNRFLQPFDAARPLILITYWLAQYGIASAAVNYPKMKAQTESAFS